MSGSATFLESYRRRGQDGRARRELRALARIFFQQARNVGCVRAALAGAAARVFGGVKLKQDQILQAHHAKAHVGEFEGLGALDRAWRKRIGGGLDRGPLLAGSQPGLAPVVGVVEAALVLEAGTFERANRDIVVAREREVDVSRGALLFGVELHRDSANQGVAHALLFEQIGKLAKCRFLGVSIRQTHGQPPESVEGEAVLQTLVNLRCCRQSRHGTKCTRTCEGWNDHRNPALGRRRAGPPSPVPSAVAAPTIRTSS